MSRPFRILAALAALALAAAVLPLTWSSAGAVPDGAVYRRLAGFEPTGPRVRVRPDHYNAVRVDTARVRSALSGAPAVGSTGSTVFRVPTPSGGTERFAVQRTQLMEAGLAAAHPEISTWAGRSLDHPGTTIAMDVTPMGFHASVRSGGQGAWYVDPAYNGRGTTEHLSYYGGSLPRPEAEFVEREAPQLGPVVDRRQAALAAGEPVTQRVYRLALLTDPTYATYFGTANVTAEKVTLMNRVNQIYNDDLAINMVLVDGTDALNLDTVEKASGPDGPCGAHPCFDPASGDPDSPDYVPGQLDFCGPGLLRTQTVLGQLVGASGYDIGHLMLGVDGGGVAALGAVGGIEKAVGCTGLSDPTGDFMAIDYVAHEMGHQFGGNHTFNGVQDACGPGNREPGASVEPGSGSSVMAYAGICLQDDLQPHTDPYFSQRTQDEVTAYTSSDPLAPVEVQHVSLTGFDTDGESITLGYPGTATTFTLTRGGAGATAYDAANIENAVEALTGVDVTISGWAYEVAADPDEPAPPLTAPDDTGFQVIFAGDAHPLTTDSDRADMADLVVTASGATVHVGESTKGGRPGNQGFAVNPTGNHAPVVTAPATRTIPTRTPFTLTGSGSDPDGDPLVYLWEQNDDAGGHAGTALVSNRKRWGPLFRVFGTFADVSGADSLQYHSPGENVATATRSRTFPDLAQILAGNTNAKTGRCPSVPALPDNLDNYVPVKPRPRDCYSEFLPTSDYRGPMHFRLTARDQVAGGGGVGHDEVTIGVDRDAGPFLVSSFARGGTVDGGTRQVVTWQVNGTQRLAKRVRIVLSTNNGRTWTKVLTTTANDGRARVRFPKVRTGKAWLKVEAVDNYFFDLSDHSFRIR